MLFLPRMPAIRSNPSGTGVIAIATMVELENADQGEGCVNFFVFFTFLQISTAETRVLHTHSTFHVSPTGVRGLNLGREHADTRTKQTGERGQGVKFLNFKTASKTTRGQLPGDQLSDYWLESERAAKNGS